MNIRINDKRKKEQKVVLISCYNNTAVILKYSIIHSVAFGRLRGIRIYLFGV